jgi:hypothetical protein
MIGLYVVIAASFRVMAPTRSTVIRRETRRAR